MATADAPAPEITELDRDAGLALVEDASRHYLGMGAREFIETWESGGFDEGVERPEVVRVALLLPFGR
jgi:hypothetical protein